MRPLVVLKHTCTTSEPDCEVLLVFEYSDKDGDLYLCAVHYVPHDREDCEWIFWSLNNQLDIDLTKTGIESKLNECESWKESEQMLIEELNKLEI